MADAAATAQAAADELEAETAEAAAAEFIAKALLATGGCLLAMDIPAWITAWLSAVMFKRCPGKIRSGLLMPLALARSCDKLKACALVTGRPMASMWFLTMLLRVSPSCTATLGTRGFKNVDELTPCLVCNCASVWAKPTRPGTACPGRRALAFASFGLTKAVLTSALESILKFMLRSVEVKKGWHQSCIGVERDA